jgi:hypothetical protein
MLNTQGGTSWRVIVEPASSYTTKEGQSGNWNAGPQHADSTAVDSRLHLSQSVPTCSSQSAAALATPLLQAAALALACSHWRCQDNAPGPAAELRRETRERIPCAPARQRRRRRRSQQRASGGPGWRPNPAAMASPPLELQCSPVSGLVPSARTTAATANCRLRTAGQASPDAAEMHPFRLQPPGASSSIVPISD